MGEEKQNMPEKRRKEEGQASLPAPQSGATRRRGKDPEQLRLELEIDEAYARELREEENAVEAVLFAMGGSVELSRLALALNTTQEAAELACGRLLRRYESERRGIAIRRFENSYQMCTNEDYYENLIRVAANPKKPVLTDVVLETLAIIAYKQPVTKADIENIRGVKSDHAVNRLVEYELVYEVGRLDAPGRPALFGTTEEFLRRFGVSALDNLPGIGPEAQAEIESEVQEELSEALGETVVLRDGELVQDADGVRLRPEDVEGAFGPDEGEETEEQADGGSEKAQDAGQQEGETDETGGEISQGEL